MGVVRPFDPWGNPLCPCPLKYGVNPYTGCGHRCVYCYITSYIPKAFEPRPKDDLLRRALDDLRKIPKGAVVSIANSSDPYTPPEAKLKLTRSLLEALLSRGYRVLLVTKSPLVLRDLDILSKYPGQVAVQLTVTTLEDALAERLEPLAPRPGARLIAVKRLAEAGIPVGVRLDPIIPYINDGEEGLKAVVEAAAAAGARQLVSSTYKAKPDNFARLAKAFPEAAERLRETYFGRGKYMHGQWYAPAEYRLKVLSYVGSLSKSLGLEYNICREEFMELNTPGTYCDGSHMLMPLNSPPQSVFDIGPQLGPPI